MKLTAPLYMLRHGETVWNTERRMQGSKNSDLTPRGRVQALAMGRTLKAELDREPGPTIFLRSPLGRTRETSEIIGRELGIASSEWRDDMRLAELSYGTWEGFSWAEIEIDHPTAMADWRADPHGYCPPGGETHIDLRRRCEAVLTEIATSGLRTVVVSHGVSGAVVRGLNLGLDARAMFVLEKPQDAFFRLIAGSEERIACDL
ncbi:histidine phosphatase family protein [Reyranella aquatilis]|uniref:Histidine phosphatase family protein n=1 Tax=Reyranella aquatilis TaxID=2035356 RepID=A0ABS8KU24_9HYPH|nr:histidine phosphatase family protein [Reyranella aquatilis]MCC8429579.1 histidine phosphatase family protein [Reyranella aquatilis]